MSGNGRCNYNKYMYPLQWSLDLCAGPSGGRDKHFSTYFVLLSLWKLNLSVQNQKIQNILSTLLTQPHIVFFWLQKAGSPISGKALFQHNQAGATDYVYYLSCVYIREVTKILSCQVNTTSRHGIKQLEIFLNSIFLPFFLRCQANSMLKSLPSTFTRTECSYMYIRRYQTNFSLK